MLNVVNVLQECLCIDNQIEIVGVRAIFLCSTGLVIIIYVERIGKAKKQTIIGIV